MIYLLIAASILPTVYFIGFIIKQDGRLKMLENPLWIIYFIIVFGYFYVYWQHPQFLTEYIHLPDVWKDIIYGVLAFSPVFQGELAN